MAFDLLQQRSVAFRSAAALAKRKWAFLQDLPYSLARARQVSVMRSCLEEFRRTPEGKRHRVAKEFFDEDSALLPSVLEFIDTGEVAPALAEALLSIEQVPITEE